MRKVYAFDADGTLLRKDSTVHPKTKQVLKKISEQGGILIVATGRGLPTAKQVLEQVPFFDYIVCSNGVVAYDVKKDKFIIHDALNPDHIQYFMDLKNNHDLVLTIDTPPRNFTLVKDDGDKLPDWFATEALTTGFDNRAFAKEQEVWDYMSQGNNKNMIVKYALRIKEAENQKWFNAVSEHVKDAKAYITNRFFIDVNPTGTSKYNGIEFILKKIGETVNHLTTFGDSNNDMEMVENAHVGVAMGNATDELKAVADVIIGDHDTDAIAKFLENEIHD
ncbi:COF family HAD hydrolase protein [Mycoplasmopsis californica]|uniref:HAD family hydrolase n=1 Tax=Mycoplasmopsis equigenitalium TaxID=114883 RepID=A0ABY5J1E7_9BACT|nr:HAD family hydrolase [Mycoplasmopsis equigenitalium]UUD37066.1 HAD family hydrolase [Mycoplasmopsis equigenitalium]VEU69633.1 COF family HAD hydrolase protein [Mycoplasmopsis californica]